MEAKVVDEAGVALDAGEAGELWLRGSLVTTGYAGDERATTEAIADGWFRTGDVARIDAEGYVYVLDRLKDMINRGGHKLYSVEIEQLLLAHPGIAAAAVAGVPDRVAGETVACWVVPEERHGLRVRDVRHWIGERMADYAVPRHVEFVDELPHNATGKVDKPLLRERLTG
jgi:acyl-CoA synthetase (AMP-forming)/AMP-acid ligase II